VSCQNWAQNPLAKISKPNTDPPQSDSLKCTLTKTTECKRSVLKIMISYATSKKW
jgi:hypothetical protein